MFKKDINIVVCIKQVPDVDDIKWTKENNLDRSLMLSRINPQDDSALDWAIRIKSFLPNAKITALSMGPAGAKRELEYALSKGADRAILLCDKAFAASDTLATTYIITAAIKKYLPDFDLILTGQMAQDGDTAQVPVSLAQMLGIFDVQNCIDIQFSEESLTFVQELEDKINKYRPDLPLLAAIKKECPVSHKPLIEDYARAQKIGIEQFSFDDLDISKDKTGILGSPTFVFRAFRPEINKDTKEIKENIAQKIKEIILKTGQSL